MTHKALVAIALLSLIPLPGHAASSFARSIQGWAVGYRDNDGDRLFTGVVSVASDESEIKIVTSSDTWNALDSDNQDQVMTNAENAVKEAYCAAGHSGLIPGLIVRLIDKSGHTLDWKVTGPGQSC
ncbi:MAG: hypothetical protein WA510_28275 [Acidobacteriaceae bacterium]